MAITLMDHINNIVFHFNTISLSSQQIAPLWIFEKHIDKTGITIVEYGYSVMGGGYYGGHQNYRCGAGSHAVAVA
jgi:squalene cyclase